MFYKLPAEMIGKYRPECVVLYALMYSRLLLSVNNPKFQDENGQAFIHFSVSEVRHALMCGRSRAERVLKELEENGIIRRVQPGIGLPCRIYILVFFESCPPPSRAQKVKQAASTPVPLSIGDFRRSYQQTYERIEADILIANRPQDKQEILEIVRLITDVVTSTAPTIRIGREQRPTETVIAQYARLDAECIEYVLDELQHYIAPIDNVDAFLKTALYNATLQRFHIDNQIAVDLAG